MFEIRHLKENTYYIDAPTKVGLYKLDNKNCILIDTCSPGPFTNRLLETIEHYNLHVKAIFNTHGHLDHFGSISVIKEKYHAVIAAPPFENTFIEHPKLYVFLMFPSVPFSDFEDYHLPKGVSVEIILDQPQFNFENVNFNVVRLPGHTPNQAGIVTPDNIIFAGDAFLGEDVLERVKIYYNYNVSDTIDSMHYLLNATYDYYVPSHGKPESLTNAKNVIEKNLASIYSTCNQVHEILSQNPLSIDEIMKKINTKLGISKKYIEYYTAQSCIIGILSFLENNKKIKSFFNNGTLKFETI